MNDEGVQTTRYEDGSEMEMVLRPDAVLGAGVSVPVSTTIRTPSGREARWEMEQSAVIDGTVLAERTTRVITNASTPLEATTTQTLTLDPDGASRFEVRSAEGRTGSVLRNAEGELVEIVQPGRHPVSLEYDDRGRLVRVTQGPPGAPDEARVLQWALPTLPSAAFEDVTVTDATGRSVSSVLRRPWPRGDRARRHQRCDRNRAGLRLR